MKTVATLLIMTLLTGCASSMHGRRMSDAGENYAQPQYNPDLLALGVAMMQASGPHALGTPPANDYAWAWDLQRAPGSAPMWVCRGIQTGQYSDPAHCAYKPRIDSQWPGY